jgi:hypothetical protein
MATEKRPRAGAKTTLWARCWQPHLVFVIGAMADCFRVARRLVLVGLPYGQVATSFRIVFVPRIVKARGVPSRGVHFHGSLVVRRTIIYSYRSATNPLSFIRLRKSFPSFAPEQETHAIR